MFVQRKQEGQRETGQENICGERKAETKNKTKGGNRQGSTKSRGKGVKMSKKKMAILSYFRFNKNQLHFQWPAVASLI